MKITDRQICEDQIVTFKQSHILLYQGLLFLTRSTCVIVDARSQTCKSHDFIPRYDIKSQIIGFHDIDLVLKIYSGSASEGLSRRIIDTIVYLLICFSYIKLGG